MTDYSNPAVYASPWRSLARGFLQRVLFRALVRSQVKQHIEVDPAVNKIKGAFLLVANHSSHLDAPMLAQGLPYQQGKHISTGVAYEYFFKKWSRRIFVRALFNAFPIDRDGSKKHAGLSRNILRSGLPVLVFPEGTRSLEGKITKFKPGAASLAVSENLPIVPAALVGAYEAMPKGRNWPVPGKPPVGVIFGAPLYPQDGETGLSFNDRVQAAVLELYRENYEQIMQKPAPAWLAVNPD